METPLFLIAHQPFTSPESTERFGDVLSVDGNDPVVLQGDLEQPLGEQPHLIELVPRQILASPFRVDA